MEDNIYKNLGKKLLYFRKRAKISQLDLEMSIDTSPGTISRIENGSINPNKETINKIAKALDLNGLELDYLIGTISLPSTESEKSKAVEEVKELFYQKGVLAYLVDDRSILIDISKDFLRLGGFKDKEKLIGQSMPKILLDSSFGITKFLEEDKYEEILREAFARTYSEMSFMVGDPYYNLIMETIDNYPLAKRIWKELGEKPRTNLRVFENRTVYFNIKGVKIKMEYSTENLLNNYRFKVLQYKPTNIILKLLSRTI